MNNVVTTLAPLYLIGSSSFLLVTRTTIQSRMGSKFGQIRPWTVGLAAIERLKNPIMSETYNRRNVLATLVLSIDLIRSFL